eukprot:1441124-Rhodomonas_salina.2
MKGATRQRDSAEEEDAAEKRKRNRADSNLGDHEENVLALLDSYAHNSRHRLHAKLLHRLPAHPVRISDPLGHGS